MYAFTQYNKMMTSNEEISNPYVDRIISNRNKYIN